MHNIYKGTGTAIYDKSRVDANQKSRIATGFYTLTNDGAWQPKIDNTHPIGPTEGLLIKTTKAMTLTIDQITSNGATRSSAQSSSIKIKVEDAKYEDVAYVIFEDDAIALDKINHRNPDIPMIYISESDMDYAIAVKERTVEEIPVSFKANGQEMDATRGIYTISLSTENYPCKNIILIDNKNGNTIDILKEKYTFYYDGYIPGRFTIKILHNDYNNAFGVVIYTDKNNIIVDNISGNAIVNVYDIKGNVVVRCQTSDSRCMIDTGVMSSGVYIVNVTDDNGVKTQKVVK